MSLTSKPGDFMLTLLLKRVRSPAILLNLTIAAAPLNAVRVGSSSSPAESGR